MSESRRVVVAVDRTRLPRFFGAVLLFLLCAFATALADNLIIDGSFETALGCGPGNTGWCGGPTNDGAIILQSQGTAIAPDGMYFLALQSSSPAGSEPSDYATVTQTITGLTVGANYTLTFDLLPWSRRINDGSIDAAGCQYYVSVCANTQGVYDGYQQWSEVQFTVADPNNSANTISKIVSTPIVDIVSPEATGQYDYSTFYTESFSFTAADTTLVFSFDDPVPGFDENSDGNNPGIDAVALEQAAAPAPEPGSLGLLGVGMLAVCLRPKIANGC